MFHTSFLGLVAGCGASPGALPAVGGDDGRASDIRVDRDLGVAPRADGRRSATTRVLTNTMHVEDLAVADGTLWVATRGGVEAYAVDAPHARRHYTTLDGLADNHVWSIDAGADGVVARTREASCAWTGTGFRCEPAPALPVAAPSVADAYQGARETARVGRFVGTAGAGVWIDGASPRQLSPSGQICSNHMMAIGEWGGRVWLGGFDDGLCVTSDFETFASVEVPFRMVNDLVATPKGLYVAAAAGLFHTRDGETFERVEFVDQRGVNGVAFDGKSLWATTPGALWRVRVNGGPRSRAYWRPGGTRSLQGVAVGKRSVWLASEDKGAIRKTRTGFEVFDRAAGAPTSWSLAVAVDNRDTAWVATLRHGLIAIDRRGRIRTVDALPDTWLLDVRATGTAILVGTQGGAARIDPTGAIATIAHLPHPNVHAFHTGRGGTWIATESGTLLRDTL